MGRGGSDHKATTLMDRGVSETNSNKIEIAVLGNEINLAKECIKNITASTQSALKRSKEAEGIVEEEGKKKKQKPDNRNLSDLAFELCSPVDTVCGLLKYELARREECLALLKEVVGNNVRDLFEAAIEARYRLKMAEISISSLEEQLKKAKEAK